MRADPAQVFSALGDPVRLALLARLAGGSAVPLGRLVEGCGVSRQGATKHLKVLEEAGLISAESSGRERRLKLAPGGFTPAEDWLAGIARGWEDALVRLKAQVEGERPEPPGR